ncbi:MAG: hypothetical protein IJ475_00240 [Bacilli bacterium]|nr:hypothetical protein [Bacilli bacterium]
MKRDRNTFFTNYSAQNQSYIPNIPQQIPTGFGPYQAASTESSFYAGPNIAATNDLENRINKIERQINRLDNRLTKLENSLSSNLNNTNDTNYQNMYMI